MLFHAVTCIYAHTGFRTKNKLSPLVDPQETMAYTKEEEHQKPTVVTVSEICHQQAQSQDSQLVVFFF